MCFSASFLGLLSFWSLVGSTLELLCSGLGCSFVVCVAKSPNLCCLISILTCSWLVSFQSFYLEMTLGHQILQMYLRHRLIKDCNFLWISVLTNHVSHPYNSTDFTHELNILIFYSSVTCTIQYNITTHYISNIFIHSACLKRGTCL
jgi:hypothetical protein